jgi:hypothetical protein
MCVSKENLPTLTRTFKPSLGSDMDDNDAKDNPFPLDGKYKDEEDRMR